MRNNNRRTLARKITRTTRLCILLAIMVFTATISFLSIYLTKQNGAFFAGMFANLVADRLSSTEFLNYMRINNLSAIRPSSSEANSIYLGMKELEDNTYEYYLVDGKNGVVVAIPAVRELRDFIDTKTLEESQIISKGETSFGDVAQVRILINGDEIYRSDYWDRLPRDVTNVISPENVTPTLKHFFSFFRTEASYYIPDKDGKTIGEVQVRLSSMLNFTSYLTLLFGIVSAGIASYIASLILTSFFTKNVAKPFVVMDQNLKYLAEGNYDELLNSHIHVKKPLKEIQSIAESTNVILDKMHEFNKIISSQNELLEKQNNELEAQNEEIVESKKQIHDAQSQLVQNQNMASVGQLTAAISHEINTPLGTINSNVQLQNMILDMLIVNPELSLDAELIAILNNMRNAGSLSANSCSQVSSIIKSLKNFSRLDQADYQEANINDSAKSVVLLTRYLWKNRIVMHEDYGSLPFVKCYPGLLNQVFMNILVNAIRAIHDQGNIYIKTWADSGHVYASIRDDGVGIAKDRLINIFEPGYGFDETEKGITLGLSICKNIIEKHNGSIEVRSEFGEGTEFIFKLPII